MPPGSSPSGGFRESLKRRAHRVKKWLGPKDQASTPDTPSPHPQTQPSCGVPLPPHVTATQEPPARPPAPIQSTAPLPLPVPSAGVSASASNPVATDTIQSAGTEAKLSQTAKKAGADAWAGLKTALHLLKDTSDVLPPLKAAVAEFLDVVDVFEAAAQNRKDYAELASNLRAMVDRFKDQPGEYTSSRMSEALKAMRDGLEKEIEHALEQHQRSRRSGVIKAGENMIDVKGCHRRFDNLCRELQNTALLRTWSIAEEQQANAHLKDLNAALKAMYNSRWSKVIGRRSCTPGTRKAVLAGMREWADNPNGPKVYWLNGMAGTGKTTLAYSFCAEMERVGRLGASFFCSRADLDSQDASRIVPTIAHQLARLMPSYREALVGQIDKDKDVGERDIETQFEQLIRAPLRNTKPSELKGVVVTVDALDECNRREGAQELLEVLLDYRDLPIRFLVTCRPEPGLFDALQSKDESYRAVLHVHDIESSFVQADIRTYLEAELDALSLPAEKLEQLVEQAGTLFIYAATAARYIRPRVGEVNYNRRLEQLLSIASTTKTNKHKGIDDLYRTVLAASLDEEDLDPEEKETVRLVLDTAVCAREPMSVTTMARLLGLDDEHDVRIALQRLLSVLHVSQGTNLISTLHTSFPDFMLDHERSKDMWCNATKHHEHLSLRCFSTMERQLRFNICELESSFMPDEKVPGLVEKIRKAISPELLYACRCWPDHLVSVPAKDRVHSAFAEFLSSRLLFWMEVLNLTRCMHIGVAGLYQVRAWVQRTSRSADIQQLAQDAGGFVTMVSSNTVSRSTPHIYISALPFWPEGRPVSKQYLWKMQGLPKASGAGMRRREGAALAVFETHSTVYCAAYSSDGAHIVSGSSDYKIRIWDAHTFKQVGEPLEGHTSWVKSVGYSSDDARIVSGSDDRTIRIWDAHTGEQIGEPLEGHTNWVSSVGYSSDGARIVSGSQDGSIRIWDALTGKQIGEPLEGHTGGVNSVGYSSNGARIVSGSDDKTIRIWEAHTGKQIDEPLEGHTNRVNAVGYSPDGARIVSGSWDCTIRMWDAHTGEQIGEPLEGHAGYVTSVEYSSDGSRIVSGSYDETIRLWDGHTGEQTGEPLEGHTNWVNSVGYSSDGARIVSGSFDRTIRIWDARTGKQTGKQTGEPLEGHIDAVNSVGYSSDGARIVSGSSDGSIRIWDALTGKQIGEPLEGHTNWVSSVGFSSDGARIVSGSQDKTIWIWDAYTGKQIGEPLEGHTGAVNSVGYSSDGAHIVSGSQDGTIRIWDAHTGKQTGELLEGHTGGISSVRYSSDGARIVSGSQDKTIRTWDAHTGEQTGEPLEGHIDEVNSVGYSPDGARIVSGSSDRTIRIWDAHTGKQTGEPLEGHTDAVFSVEYSSDGSRIVSASEDGAIRIWDAHTGRQIGEPLEGHTTAIMSVGYSLDGAYVASGGFDNTIRIHKLEHLSKDPCNTWVLDQNGYMLVDGSKLLMWVPSDVRDTLLRPQNTAVISTKGSVRVDFTDAHIGASWSRCYRPS